MTKLETLDKPKLNLMTSFTQSVLLDNLSIFKEEYRVHKLAVGEAAGRESDWHDNAAFDEANRLVDLTSAQISQIEKKLANVQIISPREDISTIDIGNTVVVKFVDKTDNETFTILGPDDSGKNPGWISKVSPFGKCLLGKKSGDKIEYSTENTSQNLKQKFKIISIQRGNF